MQRREPDEEQKRLIKLNGLCPENWIVIYESKTTLEIVSRRKSMHRVLRKRKGIRQK